MRVQRPHWENEKHFEAIGPLHKSIVIGHKQATSAQKSNLRMKEDNIIAI